MASNEELVKEDVRSYEITDLQNQGALAVITKAEIDTQIATAHAYNRSLTAFHKKAMAMVSMNKEIADECFYVIPRAGKTIEGPSVRLAEIVAASYGNMRCGARVVAEEQEFVVAQGVCHDLENNLAITMEVKRRITDQRGNRYNSDMIGVTGNAASSIGLRNAIFRVVPKILWLPLYEEARRLAKGDVKTFEVKREAVLVGFEKLGVPRKEIFQYLKIEGIQDINSDHLITLIGIGNAIKNGEATINDLKPEPSGPKRVSETKEEPATQGTAPAQTAQAPAPASQESQPATQGTAPGTATNGSSMFAGGDADPYLTPAEIQDFWTTLFNAGWKKKNIEQYLKRHYQLENPKDLRKSHASKALSEMLQPKK